MRYDINALSFFNVNSDHKRTPPFLYFDFSKSLLDGDQEVKSGKLSLWVNTKRNQDLTPGMKLGVNTFKPVFGDMRVDLRGADIRMSQKFLNHSKISTSL